MSATAYSLTGSRLNDQCQTVDRVRCINRRTRVFVGEIRGSVRRIESLLRSVRKCGGVR